MGRPSYVCATCSEHFTRKYSAKRHNQNLHNGAAEIVRLIDYLAGRSSGQYVASHPFWYKHSDRSHLATSTVADSVGDAFQPTYIPQQAPQQYSIHRSLPTIHDQSYGSGLSQDTIVKIGELKRLVNKYPQYHNNDPDEIVKWAIYCSSNGDNKFLDDMLEQLRTFDSLAKSRHFIER